MGYGVYDDPNSALPRGTRFAGYMVPAFCDFKGCTTEIDRGMSYRCESFYVEVELPGEEFKEIEVPGCEFHFCEKHQDHESFHQDENVVLPPEHPDWMAWLIHESSWEKWRAENPAILKAFVDSMAEQKLDSEAIFQAQEEGD